MLFKVHDQERDFTDHIDPAQLRVELDAVEQARPAFDLDDVSQMQISVTFPDKALRQPTRQDRLKPQPFGNGPRFQTTDRGFVPIVCGGQRFHHREVVQRVLLNVASATVSRVLVGARNGCVKIGDLLGECVDQHWR